MGHVAEQGLSVQQSLALEATFPEMALDLISGIGLADKTSYTKDTPVGQAMPQNKAPIRRNWELPRC